MNKRDLAMMVQERMGGTELAATRAIDAVLGSIRAALEAGGPVRLKGFGTFTVRGRKSRLGRNPNTGQLMEVPSHKTVHFKCSRQFRDLLNR